MCIRFIMFIVTGAVFVMVAGCVGTSKMMENNINRRTISETNYSSQMIKREKKVVQYTFLDTINKENEIVLLDSDLSNSIQSDILGTTSTLSGPEFCVQVFASNRIESIREQKRILEKNTTEQIKIGYDAPYYKLYAGGYTTRQDAQITLMKLQRAGYQDAWIVDITNKP